MTKDQANDIIVLLSWARTQEMEYLDEKSIQAIERAIDFLREMISRVG